jgi:arginyl-tRNA synthetase
MQSETTKHYIQDLLQQAGGELGFDLSAGAISVPESNFGDYATNAALVAAKKLSRNPKELAEQIIGKLKELDRPPLGDSPKIASQFLGYPDLAPPYKGGVFSGIAEAKGFINFQLSEKYLLDRLAEILRQQDRFGASDLGKKQKILVEYFQPNIAKPLHLGHLRTAMIGDALFRILKFEGFQTESDTHLGDWGTQFGLLLLAYKKFGNDKVIAKDPIAELNKLYVKINAAAEKDPQVREQGKTEFVKLEKGDAENHKLWERFSQWSWKEFEFIYTELGVRRADHSWPESFFEKLMPTVLRELMEKNLLVQSQGAQIVDLSAYNLGMALVVKSDGGTTYLLRDLATYIYRKAQGFSRQLYVVDVRQKHTLAQTFKILELLGHITSSEEAKHIAYGFLTLPAGAMSTRKGMVVGAKEFVQQVQMRALAIIQEKNPKLEDKEKVAKIVANAAIKYFDLSHNLKSDIVFDPKKAISFEGNTGPYLQYTHARIFGILRKSNITPQPPLKIRGGEGEILLNNQELSVLRQLQQFPEIVEQTAKELLPNIICNYLFELSQIFNAFYESSPVLAEKDDQLRSFRLELITATAQVLKNGLHLLGIEAPEEM